MMAKIEGGGSKVVRCYGGMICSCGSCAVSAMNPSSPTYSSPPPKNVEGLISEYVDRKKGSIFFKLTT
jgi:hypothetical protein